MYEVEITDWFSAAHRLREYNGKCEHLHGHNYKVQVAARAERPGKGGMVIDFSELKQALGNVLLVLDHAYLNDIQPFDTVEPSAENIAAFVFEEIRRHLGSSENILYSVSIWESESSKATYIRDQ